MALGGGVLFRQRSMDGLSGGQLTLANLATRTALDTRAVLTMQERVRGIGETAQEPVRREPVLDDGDEAGLPYQSYNLYLSDVRHDASEAVTPPAPPEAGLMSKWRMKDRMKTGCVALVLCLNIGVDPPDVIKISPCARMECWIDPFSMASQKALEAIGKNLQAQYERWQPRARYKPSLDPTVEDVKRLCSHCRKSTKQERVLFHYNGHGVPKPTVNGEIWLFNKSYTQYIPLSVYDLESWLGTPSIYVFDCSAAGMIVNAFSESLQPAPEWSTPTPAAKDCILLAACAAHEILPQNADLPADVFTACLTTPIKIALRWFCPRSLLKESLDPDLIDRIPGRQNDRKTLLGELNWIFTAITDTIAWNVLPRDLFQRLFRQDLLVASLFRNFLLAERIMRAANCSPQSHPSLPPTHQHPMWLAWDMAAEICLSQLPALLSDPSMEFKASPFFTDQLTAFEVWLDHGSKRKSPPEQLPIVLQVLLSQSHRFRALVLLGRFLDMGAWAVDLALSVGIFPYVLKLLQTMATDLRQILVFIWTKILALDRSCQVDLVKDAGHQYFVRFLDSHDVLAEQRAMAAFVLAVIADGHPRGQAACIQSGLIGICLAHIQAAVPREPHSPEVAQEALFLQWLCICLGKLWDGSPQAQVREHKDHARVTLGPLLQEPQPEVRAAATYALGTLFKVTSDVPNAKEARPATPPPPSSPLPSTPPKEPSIPQEVSSQEAPAPRDAVSEDAIPKEDEQEDALTADRDIVRTLLRVLCDGSPLVRSEVAIALARLAYGHNRFLRSAAAAYLKPPANIMSPTLSATRNTSYNYTQQLAFAGANIIDQNTVVRVGLEGTTPPRTMQSVGSSSSLSGSTNLQGSPNSESTYTEEARSLGNGSSTNGVARPWRTKGEEGGFYVQCVAAIYALARDPSPRVAGLGRQILRTIGVEVVLKPVMRVASGNQRNPPVPAIPPTPMPSGLVRSTSWVASTSGNLASTFRTPPQSPPSTSLPGFLQGATVGMRRVSSLEQFATGVAPRDMGRLPLRISGDIGVATTSPLPRPLSSAGLIDAAGITSPGPGVASSSGAPGLASVSMEATLPQSTLYSWSSAHFSRPILEPIGREDDDLALLRREERERLADKAIYEMLHSNVTKVSDQIATCDTAASGTKAILMHPFVPRICIADEKETIRVWDYEEGQTINSFDNHNAPDKGVSKLCLLNELDDSLLLVASSDGNTRVWKNFMEKDGQSLATAWQTIQGHKPGSRGKNAVVDWQQSSGLLYASGEVSSILAWDLERELLHSSVPSRSESCISAIAASQTHKRLFGAGYGDGYVRVFDLRTADVLVCSVRLHTQRVVGFDFQPGTDPCKMVSASVAGEIRFLDIRQPDGAYLTVEAHKGHLTCLAVHRHAPVIASGTSRHHIKIFSSTTGDQLSMVRYHNSFLGQRIGPVSCLQFHPYRVYLGAGATDSIVSVYAGESHNTR